MENKRIVLAVLIILIIGSIAYLESGKIRPTSVSPGEQMPVIIKEGLYRSTPELTGITGYINAEEGLQISDFKGKVVLIDFWTYTCVNCIRTFPHLTAWDEKYKDKGLVIIGVHTPEFEFEKDRDNVIAAMERSGIEYRVVQDNDYATWSAFENRFWPRKYLIDSDGFIRYNHIGEGAYEETELMIQKLLAEIGEDVSDIGTTGIADTTPRLRQTRELFAGYVFALTRGQNIGNEQGLQPEEEIDYELPGKIITNRIYLDGKWMNNADNLEATEDGASIVLEFTAGSVNIVGENFAEGVEMEVFINGGYVSREQAGSEVQFEGERAFVMVDEARLYNVVNGEYGSYLLKLTVSDGFTFNAFTFGS